MEKNRRTEKQFEPRVNPNGQHYETCADCNPSLDKFHVMKNDDRFECAGCRRPLGQLCVHESEAGNLFCPDCCCRQACSMCGTDDEQ